MNTVLITGANRGIGLKLVEHYCQQQWQVYATYRDEHRTLLDRTTEYDNLILLKLDVNDADAMAKLKHSMTAIAIHLLINNAGVHGPRDAPLGHTDKAFIAQWQQTLNINTLAPFLLTQALHKNLQLGTPAKVAFISSKMGSIGDNSSGGRYAYRSAKAALNAVVKSLSIDLAPYHISVVALHPGWVKTRMGGPNALIDTNTSIKAMTTVIENLNEQQSGCFLNYDGSPIQW